VKRVAFVLAVAFAAACGDNGNNVGPDSGSGGSGGSDGGMNATLTSYVLDLVQNHTTATDVSRPYSEFQALPDPDGDMNNGSAYSSLF
jgi:hypothetical protein